MTTLRTGCPALSQIRVSTSSIERGSNCSPPHSGVAKPGQNAYHLATGKLLEDQLQRRLIMKKLIVLVPLVALTLASCAAPPELTKGTKGAGVGAAGGAIFGQAIGRNTEATLIGAAVGGLLGYIVGNEMDKHDRMKLNQVYETAPSGQASSWQNPDSGNSYSVTPQPAYYPQPNQPCRKAEILATIDGKTEKTYTTACRNAEGQWELKS
jgi:surface antigen